MSDNLLFLSEMFYSLAFLNLSDFLKKIDSCDTFNDRIKIAEKNFEKIGSGSSRTAYKASDHIVIKLAKNKKGLEQNKAESQIEIESKYLNKILDFSENFYWVKTKFLEKITEKEFEKMTGVSFEDFGNAMKFSLKHIVPGKPEYKKPKNFDKVVKTDIYKVMLDIAKEYELMPGDLAKISSWLKNSKNPVLADAGLNRKVYKDYYKSKSYSSK